MFFLVYFWLLACLSPSKWNYHKNWRLCISRGSYVTCKQSRSSYHVGLPGLSADTMVNTPPELILRFSSPRKHWDAWEGKWHEKCVMVKRVRGRKSKTWEIRSLCRSCTCFNQSSRHSILSRENVTSRPATLRPQRSQSLNQHLQDTINTQRPVLHIEVVLMQNYMMHCG